MAEKKKDSFNWLRRENRGPTYISYSPFSKLSAASFEFGADGCAAACNAGGELLHLSAPSKRDGLIFVRGHFETSLYSSLSREQSIFGGPSTFGFEVAVDRPPYDPDNGESNREGSSFLLGEMIEHGSYNYRWPFNEFYLRLNDTSKEKVGTCVMFSFIKDEILYQVIRVEQGSAQDSVYSKSPKFPQQSQIALTIGGPLWFQSFDSPCRLDGKRLNEKGDVRDVSPESTKSTDPTSPTESPKAAKTLRRCIRILDTFQGLGLEARVFQLCYDASGEHYEQLDLTESLLSLDSGAESGETYGYTAFGELQNIDRRREATFLAAIRLTEVSQVRDWINKSKATSYGEWEGEIVPGIKEKDWIKQERGTKQEWQARQPDEARFLERDWPNGLWPEVEEDWTKKLPLSWEIYDYIGVSPSSVHATGAMWETAFLERERNPDSPSELVEIRLLGRCLEKILQVDLVPEPNIPAGTALVSNIFSWANVDLKAMFWKVRYLVKVYKFLSRLSDHYPENMIHDPETDRSIIHLETEITHRAEEGGNARQKWKSPNDQDEMLSIAAYQLKRIHKSIESVMRYLVHALLTPKSDTVLMPDEFMPGESNYYYVMITIWYIAKNYPWENRRANWMINICNKSHNTTPRFFDITRLPRDNCNFGKDARDRIPLLMWYHYSSLLLLCKEGWLPPEWDEDPEDLERKVARLGKVAKISTAAKLSSNQTYAPDDEIVDRLAFLAHELNLESSDGTLGTVTSLTKRRIKQRDYTRFINPGRLLPLEEGSTSSPWEIHALCHHSRLIVFASEKAQLEDGRVIAENAGHFEEYKKKLFEFMNSEATIVPCWEREHSKAFKGWLHSEVTAVVASTLLELREMPTPHNSEEKFHAKQKLKDKRKHKFVAPVEPATRNGNFLGVSESSLPAPLNWLAFRPPPRYHPDNFTISLEDMSQFYKDTFINNIPIPIPLSKYVHPPSPKGLCIDDLKAAIEKLPGSVSVSDLVDHRPSRGQRIFADHSSAHVAGTIKHLYQKQLEKLHKSIPGHNDDPRLDKKRLDEKREHDLSRSLFDSLADQGVGHRLLVVRKLSTHLLQWLLYVVHPEAAACLSSHVLCYSRFSCQRGYMWTARITLRSWILQDSGSVDAHPSAPGFDEDAPIILPDVKSAGDDDAPINFPKAFKHIDIASKPKPFKLTVSSLVISTNALGDFSRCTLISETIDDSRLVSFASECQTLWQKFANQPQVARCLVFLLALGVMCERLAQQYEEAIEAYSEILNLDEAFFEVRADGSKWERDTKSIPRFQIGLWSLESLYKLQRSLKESVGSILQAKEELLIQIIEGPDRRSDSLQRMCEEYLADFEIPLVHLTAVSSNLNRKIELSSRYKDALSAALALRDGQTSLNQNTTIERLTYLTIAYLPISLMAAILAVPGDHPVSFPGMSRKHTLILVIFVLMITYGLAFLVRPFLELIRKDGPSASAKKSTTPSASSATPAPPPVPVPASSPSPAPAPASSPSPLRTILSRLNFFSKIWTSLVELWLRLTRKEEKDVLPT